MPIQARCLICGDCHRDGLVPDCPPPQRAVAARIVSGLGGFEIVG
jgi:hypothetical protein